MENSKYEIEVERVDKQDNLELCTCSLCENIFFNPVMCKNCENHFCKLCINKWISKNPNVCPLCKNYEQKNVSSILNVLLSKLIISCVNKNKG